MEWSNVQEGHGHCKPSSSMMWRVGENKLKSNNLKLSEGTHKFTRIGGSLDEYLKEEFQFEKID